MRPPVRPCIERLPDGRGCPRYAREGDSRCEECRRRALKNRDLSPGTTPEWRRARKLALERAGHRCEKCGRTEAEARAAGTWLEVHHRSGAGVRAKTHDLADLEVLCRTPCHTATMRATPRPSWREPQGWAAGAAMKARAEGEVGA